MIYMTTTELIAVIVAIVSCIGAVSTVLYSFRNNASGIKNDIIKTYETRLTQMEDDMEAMKKKLSEIKTLLDRREGELKTITDVLQGRNPEMTAFMDTMTKTAHAASPYMTRTTTMLEALLHHYSLPIPPTSLPA